MPPRKITKVNLAVQLASWLPLAVLVWDYYHNNLTVNWIQAAEQRTGKIAITFLVLSLACTPVNTIFGWRKALHLRRPFGVYAFLYAAIHFTIFIAIDYGFQWDILQGAIFEKPFILVGLAALIILLLLAATSWRWWMKHLGMAWKRLHQLIYLAGLLVILHYAWSVKGDLFRLRGNVAGPLLYSLLVIFLLLMRLPPVRRFAVRSRMDARARRVVNEVGAASNQVELKKNKPATPYQDESRPTK